MAAAWRRVAASWLVTAPTTRNMAAVATMARAKYSEESTLTRIVGLRPDKTVMMAVVNQRVTAPMARPAMAWAAARRRVVRPASRRSQRAESSSPRSNRVLVRRPQTAPRTMSVMEILKAVKPPTVWSCGAGPKSALIALFDP